MRYVINLPPSASEALEDLALDRRRSPGDEAALIVLESLRRRRRRQARSSMTRPAPQDQQR